MVIGWLEYRIHIRRLADTSSSANWRTHYTAHSYYTSGLFFVMMFTVYVLYSEKYNKIYTGYTSNMEQRLLAHNEPETKGYTLKFSSFQIHCLLNL